MEGFASAGDSDDSDSEDDEEEALLPEFHDENDATRDRERVAEVQETEILGGDEVLSSRNTDDEEALDVVEGPPLSKVKSRGSSRGGRERSSERKISNPIGISELVGPGGSRRLSNGLAASNLGQGTGGTSFT